MTQLVEHGVRSIAVEHESLVQALVHPMPFCDPTHDRRRQLIRVFNNHEPFRFHVDQRYVRLGFRCCCGLINDDGSNVRDALPLTTDTTPSALLTGAFVA